jgi:hypothetical protein
MSDFICFDCDNIYIGGISCFSDILQKMRKKLLFVFFEKQEKKANKVVFFL